MQSDPSQGPLDGIEDTLIGVQNNSSGTIGSLVLSSNTDLFAFDGDGLCAQSVRPAGCPFGPTGYEGTGTSFSNINPAQTGGIVSFTNGLAPGASAYFSLEEALTSTMIVTGGPTPGEQGGPPNPAERLVLCSTALPVNCATGAFWHQWDDLSVPGRGMALDFQRTYSSAAAGADGPLGFGWTDSYNMALSVDGSGNVTVSQEDGAMVSFSPNGSGGYVAAPRVLATLAKNGDGSYTFARDDDLVQYTFSSAGQLVKEVDRNGYTTSLAYDGSGQLASVTDPAGRALTFAYSGSHIASVTGPGPRTESFTYDGSGNLQTATDPAGGVWSFTYDANHRLLTMQDPNGGVTTNVYDSSGRVTSQTDPMNRQTTWSYSGDSSSPAGGTTTVTDAKGNATTLHFENLELLSKTEAAGTSVAATTSYAYDPATLGITQLTDPDNHTSTSTYDANGNQVSFTDPLNRQTTATYNGLNEPLTVKDPSGVTTTRTYDAKGNLLSVSRPLDGSQTQTVTYHYDDANHLGDVTSITDPNGHVTSSSYDSQGDLASITDALGDETTFSYDTLGERTAMVSPRGNVSGGNPSAYTTSYQYDQLGRLTQTTDPLGHITKQSYDRDGNLTSTTDADNNTTNYSYDADNELTKISRADGTTLQYAYDGDGNQTNRTDGASHGTSYSYDALDRVGSSTDPLNRTTSYGYDGAGNLTSLTDPSGRTMTYGYDAANELTSISYSDGTTPNVSFSYTPNGLRATMNDGTGVTNYSYDQLNRLISQTNGDGQTVSYGYDLADNLTSLTYPNGKGVTRSYDNANRLTGVTDWLGHTTSFMPDPDSNVGAISYPNGITSTSVFDSADQLGSITDKNSGGSTLASFTYGRDNNGQLTSETPTGSGQGSSQSYSYDQLNRLTSVNSTSYSYDAADNLTGLISGASQRYDNANQLNSSTLNGSTSSYSYDKQGNRTGSSSTSLTTSGNEITDAVRSADIQGDGRTPPDSSFGIWEDATNLCTNGGLESSTTGWAAVGSSTISRDTSAAKFGSASLKVVTPGAAIGEGAHFTSTATYSGGGPFTFSAWVKAPAGATLVLNGALSGVATKSTNFTATGSWQRVSVGGSYPSGGPGTLVLEVLTSGTKQAITFSVDGAQVEQQPVPTPYVETNGATATRGDASMTAPSSLFSASQGWVAIRARAEWSSSSPPGGGSGWEWLYDWRTDSNNRYSLYYAESSKQFKFIRMLNGSQVSASWTTQTIAPGDTHTIIAKWVNASTIAISVDGGNFVSATLSGSFSPSKSSFNLGTDYNSLENWDGEILWAAAGTGSLANSDAATINNFGNTDPTISQLPGGPGFAWSADTAAYQTPGSNTTSYSYDQANRLTAATANSTTSSYTYDGDGLRASETSGGSTQHFAWDISGDLPLLLTDGTLNYIYDDQGVPVEQIDASGTPLYYQHDQLGSTRLLTDQNGNPGATYTYDPYGNQTSHTGTANTPLRWAGQYFDTSSGLYYLRARYYDPEAGQFVERDPAEAVAQEPYAYAYGSPLSAIDPGGLAPTCEEGQGGRTLAAVGSPFPPFVLYPINHNPRCFDKALTLTAVSYPLTQNPLGFGLWLSYVTATVQGHARSFKTSIVQLPGNPVPPNAGIYSSRDLASTITRLGGYSTFVDTKVGIRWSDIQRYLVNITAAVRFRGYSCYYEAAGTERVEREP